MSSTLTISDLDVAFGARTLFTGLNLTLADGDVTAVVGPNGSGKSTLMRTIVGELLVESGSIRLVPRDATVAWLPQVLPDPAETLMAYARRRTGVEAADAELESASAAIASGAAGADDRYAHALERWLALGAADLEDRPGTEIYSMRVFPYESLYIGLVQTFLALPDDPVLDVQLADGEAIGGLCRCECRVGSHQRSFVCVLAEEAKLLNQ